MPAHFFLDAFLLPRFAAPPFLVERPFFAAAAFRVFRVLFFGRDIPDLLGRLRGAGAVSAPGAGSSGPMPKLPPAHWASSFAVSIW
jgi:hypothetical protein